MENPEKEETKQYRGVKAMPFIIGNETFEKLGTIGTSSNLLVYLTTVFGMKSLTATNVVNVYTGSANFATLIGAFLSDTYYGRYNTLAFSSVSSFMGMVVLTLTAAIHNLHPNQCTSQQYTNTPTNCEGPTTGQTAVLVTGLALLVVGAGGIRPCNLAFGADQFDPTTESGKRGTTSFFNWYYFTFTFAVMVSMTFIVYVQSSVSWALGLAIPALLMLLSCAVFFAGTRVYVRLRPQGSPLVSVAQVIVAAFKKRKLRLPATPMAGLLDHVPTKSVNSKIPYTDQFRTMKVVSSFHGRFKNNSTQQETEEERKTPNQEVMDNKEKPQHEEDESNRIKYPGIKAMPFIIGNETFEKLGAIGTLSNLLVYLTTVFNLKSITATTIINVFYGTTNFATLLGAFLCDSYFGRFVTLGFSTVCSFLGLLVIALTAVAKNLHPPSCAAKDKSCTAPTPCQMAFLMMGFGLMVVGAAGVRPCNLAFGADQFDPASDKGKRGINSFFNWYFFTFTFAQMVSLTFIVYLQTNVSWSIGLGVPAALMLVACLLFLMGSRIYVRVKPQGSPMTSMLQVLVVAVKKRRFKLPVDDPSAALFNFRAADSINSKLTPTNDFRFLDKAAIKDTDDEINPDGSPSNPWKLCSMQQVEEAKCVIRVLPIWASAIIYHVPIVQMHTYAVFQALQSDRRLGSRGFKIPAASYNVFLMLTFTLWIPIYDRLVVPSLRKLTGREGGITVLQRMGIGVALSSLSMLVSGLVEERRRAAALTMPTLGVLPHGRGAVSSMSGLWLVPQMALAGLSEAFMAVAQVEFYYKEFPENMRSVAGSLFFCGMAMSSYVSSFLVSVVHRATEKAGSGGWLAEDLNKGRLDYFYYIVAVLGALDLVYFLVCARWYKYKGTRVIRN